jgi:hypothetical protein
MSAFQRRSLKKKKKEAGGAKKRKQKEEAKAEAGGGDDFFIDDGGGPEPEPKPEPRTPKKKKKVRFASPQYQGAGGVFARDREEKKMNENIAGAEHFNNILFKTNSGDKKYLKDEREKYCRLAAEILANCRWGKKQGKPAADTVVKAMRSLRNNRVASVADLEGEGGRKKKFIMDALGEYEADNSKYVGLASSEQKKLEKYAKLAKNIYR